MKTFTPTAHQRKLEKAAELMYFRTESGIHYGGCLLRACLYASENAEPVIILIPGNTREMGRFMANHMNSYPLIRISYLDDEAICELRGNALATYGDNDDMKELRGQFARFSVCKDDGYMQIYKYETIPHVLNDWWHAHLHNEPGKLHDLAAELKSA